MVVCMTSSENRALQAALRRGYLSFRRDQRTLLDHFSQLCAKRQRPVLRLERHLSQCQVVLQWQPSLAPINAQQQQALRSLVQESRQAAGLLPIVFRHGVYSEFMHQEAAEALAVQLADWIEEQFSPA